MNISKKSIYEVNDDLVKEEQYTKESRRYLPLSCMPEGGLEDREWIRNLKTNR